MKRWLEVPVFVALAATLHLMAFGAQPNSGITAGGSGGDTSVSIQGAAPTVVEMVRMWERPPVIQPPPEQDLILRPRPPTGMLTVPDFQIDQAPRAQMTTAMVPPEQHEDVQIDTTPPPPRLEPEVQAQPQIEPGQRPLKPPEPEARKSDVASAGAAKQVSAGSGGGAHAGTDTAKVTTGSPGQKAQLQAVWGAKIRARIERNKRYPRGTKASGDATVGLTVSRDGRLISHQLTQSSGDPILDQAALSAVARTKRVPKAPKDLIGSSFRFSVLIRMTPGR